MKKLYRRIIPLTLAILLSVCDVTTAFASDMQIDPATPEISDEIIIETPEVVTADEATSEDPASEPLEEALEEAIVEVSEEPVIEDTIDETVAEDEQAEAVVEIMADEVSADGSAAPVNEGASNDDLTGNSTATAGSYNATGTTIIIKYHGNGATSGSVADIILHGSGVKGDKITYDVAENKFKRPGYIFVRWSEKKDGSGANSYPGSTSTITEGSGYKTYTIHKYAIWEKFTYSIVFSDDETNPTDVKYWGPLKYGKTYTLPKCPFKKPGYSFKGWVQVTGNNAGKTYKNKAKIKNLSDSIDTTSVEISAIWKRKNYKITYKLNKGKNDPSNPKSYTVEDSVTISDPTRSGYEFLGWYTDKKCKKEFEGITAGTTGKKTLYAKWKKIK